MSKENSVKSPADILAGMVVAKDETVSRSRTINTDANTVRLYNVSKNDKTGKNYKVDWTFDFSDCTQEEILELASRSAVIAYRKNFRKVDESAIHNFASKKVNVKLDVLAHERSSMSNTDKAKKLIDTMSDDEKADLMEQLNALMMGKNQAV